MKNEEAVDCAVVLALLVQVVFPVWAEDEVDKGSDQEILIQDDQETDSVELTIEIESDDGFISEELDDVSLSTDLELIELDGELHENACNSVYCIDNAHIMHYNVRGGERNDQCDDSNGRGPEEAFRGLVQ